MKPEDMTVVLRVRELNEAADLGVALVQRHARLVYVPWLILTVPFAVGLLALSWFYPVWAALGFWYCVIVFERAVLFALSRALFQVAPSPGTTLRAFAQTELEGVLWQLTVLRLSPRRSTTQPILQLERAKLHEYFRRAGFLIGGNQTPLLVTLSYATAELCFAFSIAVAVAFLIPQYQFNPLDWYSVAAPTPWMGVVSNAFYFASVLFIRPFYVASGFGIYLSQRTKIDGWDIELGLKSLAARLVRGLKKSVAAVLIWLVVVVGGASAAAQSQSDADPVETIRNIKASSDFHTWVESTTYLEDQGTKFSSPDFGVVGPLLRLLIIGAIAAAAVWLLYLAAKHWRKMMPESGAEAEPAWTAQSLALAAEEEFPADPVARALELVRAGRFREALSLCLRVSIAHFGSFITRPIPSGATETECLRIFSGHIPRVGEDYFRRLARMWQQLAYARDSLQTAQIEAIATELDVVLRTRQSSAESSAIA